MKTFLVTGATGFLGSALTEGLLNDGYRVIGIDQKRGFLNDASLNNKHFTFLKTDINNNFSRLLRDFDIDGIFHLASRLPFSDGLTFQDFHRGNVETTLNIVNLAKTKDIKVIVYTSTNSIFGKRLKNKYINESSLPTPSSYYGLTKYMSERLLEVGLQRRDTKVVIIRPSSIYGKNDSNSIVNTYYQAAKSRSDIELYSKGERYRNLLYVGDAVNLLMNSARNIAKLDKFEIFEAGSKNSLKMMEIAKIIKRLLDSNSKIAPIDKRLSTNWDVFIDISKAQKILNFNPMTIEKGLESYVREVQNEIQ